MSSIECCAAPLGGEGLEWSVIGAFWDIFGNTNGILGRAILI